MNSGPGTRLSRTRGEQWAVPGSLCPSSPPKGFLETFYGGVVDFVPGPRRHLVDELGGTGRGPSKVPKDVFSLGHSRPKVRTKTPDPDTLKLEG